MRILVLGASGMLGNAVYEYFSSKIDYSVYGTIRNASDILHFSVEDRAGLIRGFDVLVDHDLQKIFEISRPDVVINCIGIVKQLQEAKDVQKSFSVNTILPHRLQRLSEDYSSRLILVSTDCVYSGRRGNYIESEIFDVHDVYGVSKFFGEVEAENTITLRTSIIGHELAGSRSLINWFLSMNGRQVKGYTKAIFSGLPTVEVASVIHGHVLERPDLHGLYHLSAAPISKFDLLVLVKQIYGVDVHIEPSEEVVIDRSLNSTRFRAATGYEPAEWSKLIAKMHQFG